MNARKPQPNATKKVMLVADLSRASRRDFLSGFFAAVDTGFDWSIQLVQSPDAMDAKAAVRQRLADGLDGIVILEDWNPQARKELETGSVAIVAIGAHAGWFAKRKDQIAFLRIDDERIGAFAAQYFSRLGSYNSYVFLPSGPKDLWSRERERGFRDALEKHHAKPVTWDPVEHGTLAKFLKRLEKPIAVFAACDRIAADALAELKGSEMSVPEQVAVLGVDDDKLICQSARPALSSIRPGHYDEGVMAARKLNALMGVRKPKPRQTVLCDKLDLAERASTAFVAPAARLISAARAYIAENAVRGITPNDVAHHLGISRRLLDLRFGELNDVSVARMIRTAKLAALKTELLKSRDRLSVIGRRCGFANANYLKRIFLADTGLTMAEWRSRNR